MADKKLVEISGGFHDSDPIRVRVPSNWEINRSDICNVVSERVMSKIQSHMCGISGCTCGGVYRGIIEDVD